jgi:hypothetical protein
MQLNKILKVNQLISNSYGGFRLMFILRHKDKLLSSQTFHTIHALKEILFLGHSFASDNEASLITGNLLFHQSSEIA